MAKYIAQYRGPYNDYYEEYDNLWDIDTTRYGFQGIYINIMEIELKTKEKYKLEKIKNNEF